MTEDASPPPRGPIITRDTAIPITFAIALGLAAVAVDRRLSGLEAQMEYLRRDMQALSASADSDSLLRVRSFALWCELLQAKNPALQVPPVPPR